MHERQLRPTFVSAPGAPPSGWPPAQGGRLSSQAESAAFVLYLAAVSRPAKHSREDAFRLSSSQIPMRNNPLRSAAKLPGILENNPAIAANVSTNFDRGAL